MNLLYNSIWLINMNKKKELVSSIDEKKKYDTIVFLTCLPLTVRDVTRFGFEILKKKGFDVKVYDLTNLTNLKALLKNPIELDMTSDCVCKINSYQDLIYELEKDVSHSIFIDFLVAFSELNLSNEKIFRILKNYGAKYCIVSAGALPLPLSTNRSKYWFNRIKHAFNPTLLSNFIAGNVISSIKRYTNTYPTPEIIFSGDSEVKSYYINKYKIPPEKIVPINSFDYDTYLRYMNQNNSKCKPDYDYCVFLDEAATHHPDYDILGIKQIDENRYYHSMNNFFERVEKETGLKVIIAAHPRSKYEQIPNVFGKRKIVKGKTIELVANSSLVVAHASTSINFAILFNKPILIVKTSDMKKRGNLDFTDIMAEAIGLKAVNIDEDSLNSLSFKLDNDLNAKYKEYIYKYIKSRYVDDFFTWEIVAETIIRKNND